MVQMNGHFITTEDKGDFVSVVVDGTEYVVKNVGETFSIDPLMAFLFESYSVGDNSTPRRSIDLSPQEFAALQAKIDADERNQIKPRLAEVIFGKNISNDTIAQNYFLENNYFRDMSFQLLNGEKSIALKSDVSSKRIGLQKDMQLYIFEFGGCDRLLRKCSIRVNGISSEGIPEKSTLNIDSDHSIQITSLQFDTCGQKRFCDYDNGESYDVIEVKVQ